MAIIHTIPEEYISALSILISLDDTTFNELVSLIDKSPIVFIPQNIAKPIGEYSLKNIQSILMAIGSLFIVRERKEVTNNEIIDDICRFIEEKKIKELPLDENKEKILKQRMAILLDNEKLYLSSKPIDVLSEYENVFLSARAITDFRPIFGIDVDESPKAGMIVHNLHVHYRHGDEGNNHKDIYFALDSKDLEDLKNILERAGKKGKALQSMLEKSGITNLNTSQGV